MCGVANVLKTRRLSTTPRDISQAAKILRSGGLVAIPTETVYGLAADGLNVSAVEKIFAAKERPQWDPLILHVSDRIMLQQVTQQVAPIAQSLMDAFWPGPLTLLLPRSPAVPEIVTAGRSLAGVRMPAHPVALEILRATGRPLAAPSANRFGHISPTSADHVLADLDGRIDAVVDAGTCSVGVESTVIDPSGAQLILYRQGGVAAAEIERVTGLPVHVYSPPSHPQPPEALPSPGVGIRHYAPCARVVLVASESELQAVARMADPKTTGVLLPRNWWLESFPGRVVRWAMWEDDTGLARELYAALRELDHPGTEILLVPLPNSSSGRDLSGLRDAIRDRLLKAAR